MIPLYYRLSIKPVHIIKAGKVFVFKSSLDLLDYILHFSNLQSIQNLFRDLGLDCFNYNSENVYELSFLFCHGAGIGKSKGTHTHAQDKLRE